MDLDFLILIPREKTLLTHLPYSQDSMIKCDS